MATHGIYLLLKPLHQELRNDFIKLTGAKGAVPSLPDGLSLTHHALAAEDLRETTAGGRRSGDSYHQPSHCHMK